MENLSTLKKLFENSSFGVAIFKRDSKETLYSNRYVVENLQHITKKGAFSDGESELFDEKNSRWYRVFTTTENGIANSTIFDITDLKTASDDMADRDRELEIVSSTDKLTTLFNRAKLVEVITSEIEKSKRYKRKFSLIVTNVDNLKELNSEFGHKAGDLLLIEFAKFLTENIRTVDVIGRWDSGDVMIICPETDINGAINMAEKLKGRIEEFSFAGEVERITASFGVTGYLNGDSDESIVERVSNGLQTAKENGKNRVEFELI
jgi:diguanylate cyclase (GGDEF)-like protein